MAALLPKDGLMPARRLLTSDSSISVDSPTSYSLIKMMIDDHHDNEESQYLTSIVLSHGSNLISVKYQCFVNSLFHSIKGSLNKLAKSL